MQLGVSRVYFGLFVSHEFVPATIWFFTHVKLRTEAQQVAEDLVRVAISARGSLEELTGLEIINRASFLDSNVTVYHDR